MSIAEKALLLKEDIDEVYDAGKQAEYDAFWDTIQQNGNRELYHYTFCNTDAYNPYQQMGNWNEENFLPKYPIVPKKCDSAVFFGVKIDNFKEHCEKNGIVIDLSQAITINNFYRGLKTKRVPNINAKSSTALGSTFYVCTLLEESPDILNGELITNYNSCYNSCDVMTRIPRLWATNVTTYNSTFDSCSKLSEIEQIEGEIKVDINFKWSPLSPASLKNIVKHLKNYLGTSSEYAYTLTVKASAWEALEAAGFTDEDLEWIEEVLEIDKDTWLDFEFAWENALEALRWNLVLAS